MYFCKISIAINKFKFHSWQKHLTWCYSNRIMKIINTTTTIIIIINNKKKINNIIKLLLQSLQMQATRKVLKVNKYQYIKLHLQCSGVTSTVVSQHYINCMRKREEKFQLPISKLKHQIKR